MKTAFSVGGAFSAGYLFAFAILSPFGVYAPARFGISGVKAYAWAPLGFYDVRHAKWRLVLLAFFQPLTALDNRFWHTHAFSPDDSDPVYR